MLLRSRSSKSSSSSNCCSFVAGGTKGKHWQEQSYDVRSMGTEESRMTGIRKYSAQLRSVNVMFYSPIRGKESRPN